MRVTVKLFGNEAVAANRREVTLDLPGASATVADLRERLAAALPELAEAAARCRVAVNHEFADDAAAVHPDDEVALIGQVSGG